jgi:tetratricopeptide (TPR) repeat protein
LRQWTEAFEDLHHAQKLAADDPDVRRWSRLFQNVSKFVDEIRELDARVAAIADDPGLLADRALLLLRSGDPELALDDSEQAIKLAPWAIRPKLFKALALIALNRATECENLSIRQPLRLEWLTPEFLETISRIDSAISVERDNPDHYTARAWQLNEIGQPMLAFADAQTAVRLDAKSANGWAEVSYALLNWAVAGKRLKIGKLPNSIRASQRWRYPGARDGAWRQFGGGRSLSRPSPFNRRSPLAKTRGML